MAKKPILRKTTFGINFLIQLFLLVQKARHISELCEKNYIQNETSEFQDSCQLQLGVKMSGIWQEFYLQLDSPPSIGFSAWWINNVIKYIFFCSVLHYPITITNSIWLIWFPLPSMVGGRYLWHFFQLVVLPKMELCSAMHCNTHHPWMELHHQISY